MSAPLCTVCNGTGSKSKSMYLNLDCTFCTAATERAKVNEILHEDGYISETAQFAAWRAYQLGKAAAASEIAAKDDLIATLHRQYSEIETALAVEHAALADALRHVSSLKERLNAAPVVPVAAQPVVPEGWKLVPVKPTPKMVDSTWGDNVAGMSHNAMNKKIYGAMLAAAPQPAASVTDVAKDAARYRYLRDSEDDLPIELIIKVEEGGVVMDAAIDAAMAQGDKHEPT